MFSYHHHAPHSAATHHHGLNTLNPINGLSSVSNSLGATHPHHQLANATHGHHSLHDATQQLNHHHHHSLYGNASSVAALATSNAAKAFGTLGMSPLSGTTDTDLNKNHNTTADHHHHHNHHTTGSSNSHLTTGHQNSTLSVLGTDYCSSTTNAANNLLSTSSGDGESMLQTQGQLLCQNQGKGDKSQQIPFPMSSSHSLTAHLISLYRYVSLSIEVTLNLLNAIIFTIMSHAVVYMKYPCLPPTHFSLLIAILKCEAYARCLSTLRH